MNACVGAMSLPQESRFDQIVRSGGNLITGAKAGIAKRLGRSQEAQAMHKIALPEYLEAELVEFQRHLLKYLKRNGVNLSSLDEAAAKKQLPVITKLLLEMDKDEVMKDQIEILRDEVKQFVLKSKLSSAAILTAIRDIKCPEIIALHVDPITVGAISGACAGAVGAAITWAMSPPSPPPPPPPPPSPSSNK